MTRTVLPGSTRHQFFVSFSSGSCARTVARARSRVLGDLLPPLLRWGIEQRSAAGTEGIHSSGRGKKSRHDVSVTATLAPTRDGAHDEVGSSARRFPPPTPQSSLAPDRSHVRAYAPPAPFSLTDNLPLLSPSAGCHWSTRRMSRSVTSAPSFAGRRGTDLDDEAGGAPSPPPPAPPSPILRALPSSTLRWHVLTASRQRIPFRSH